jgi:hypothetical protein
LTAWQPQQAQQPSLVPPQALARLAPPLRVLLLPRAWLASRCQQAAVLQLRLRAAAWQLGMLLAQTQLPQHLGR